MNTASFKQVSAKYAAVAEPALLRAHTAPCLLVSSSKNANTKGTNTNATTAIRITSAATIPTTYYSIVYLFWSTLFRIFGMLR